MLTFDQPNTLMDSPVLQQAGVTPTFESPEKSVTSKVYSQARIANVGKSELYKRQWGDGERVIEVLGRSIAVPCERPWQCALADEGSWRRSAVVRLKEAVSGTLCAVLVCTYVQIVCMKLVPRDVYESAVIVPTVCTLSP